MYDTSDTTAFPRPRHPLDIQRALAFTLASAGTAALRLARAIDSAQPEGRSAEGRPRARLGPADRFDLNHSVGDRWRIK